MKQGIGFSVTINIIAIFLIVIFAFLTASLNYYKAYKVNTLISASIEKYEGYNDLAKTEIEKNLDSLGYVKSGVKCENNNMNNNYKKYSYCVYKLGETDRKFKVKVVTFITFNIPIVNQTLNLPVKSHTQSIYHFND